MLQWPMRKTTPVFLCLAGAMLNIALNRLCARMGFPLYMDTVLTISVTFTSGLFWGALCGALTNLVAHSIMFWGWEGYLFALCNVATAIITWLFIRLFPNELRLGAKTYKTAPHIVSKSSRLNMVIERMIVLILLSFALCLVMSILGGLITAFILALNPSHTGERGLSVLLSATMFGSSLPVILVEIVSRIPINIIDRLITAFLGYGIAFIFKR